MTAFSNEPVVSIKDATIFQDNNIVLNSVNLELEKGEFVFLVGRTGGGKSSLLRTLYADLPLRRGEVRVAGFTLGNIKRSKIPLLRRKVGIIFQDFQLLPDRTVAENLNFVMKATGWKESGKMKARQAEVLMQVGLGSAGSRMPHQLSGGEQQRVVIARALINEPMILLADEPTGNLDPDVSQGILALFKQINNQGTAVLMATHDHTLIENNDRGRILKCEQKKLLDSNTGDFQINTNIY